MVNLNIHEEKILKVYTVSKENKVTEKRLMDIENTVRKTHMGLDESQNREETKGQEQNMNT